MNRRRRSTPLPPLAFGANRAAIDRTPQSMQDRVEKMTNWVTRQDAASHEQPFEYQAVATQLDELKLITSASTPTVMQVDAQELSLVIPLHGEFKTRIGRDTFEYQAGQAAMLNPKCFRDSEGGVKSSLIISFDEARLNKTVQAMLGKPARASGKPFETPYLMPLKAGTVEFDRVFLTLCRLIDQFDGQPDALVAMGVSDSFYRAMALLLNQEQLLSTTEERVGGGLDKVCNYIRDHVAESIALTDLETISGLSARALQYAFMKRFNCTPMQWVRQIKAEYARELLRHPNEFITVAAVAVQCGFANFSKFSQFYQSIFHEKPSETLKNALK